MSAEGQNQTPVPHETSASGKAAPNHRNLSVDGFRGLCALYVVFVHTAWLSPFFRPEQSVEFSIREVGVRIMGLFFCLSGFLTYGSLYRLKQKGPGDLRKFYVRRIFRVLPLWWCVLAFAYFVQNEMPFHVWLANMFLYMGNLQNSSPYLPIIGSWTLFVEETFYILLPLIFPVLSFRNTCLGFLATYAISILWKLNALQISPKSWGLDVTGVWRSPLANWQFFFMGILIFYLVNQFQVFERIKTKFGRSIYLVLDVLAVLGLFSFLLPGGAYIPPEIGIFILILSVLSGESLVARFMRWPFLVSCGVWCYGVYILSHHVRIRTHYLFQSVIPETMLPPNVYTAMVIVFQLTCVVIAAAICHKVIEQPMMRLGQLWSSSQRRG